MNTPGLPVGIRATVHIEVHPSAFPSAVRRDLIASLQSRALPPRFLYEGLRQTQKWLRLHETFSPARTDKAVQRTYDRAFEAATKMLLAPAIRRSDSRELRSPRGSGQSPPLTVEVVSLGCGSGAKDLAFINQLLRSGKEVSYTPVDVSMGMVLTARETALQAISQDRCRPLVCDLAAAPDLADTVCPQPESGRSRRARVIAAFGLMPTFEPSVLLPMLARWAAHSELILVSANLAPGSDYDAGVKRVLPGYDNELTRDWLRSALQDLDIWPDDGDLKFGIEEGSCGLGVKRIVARLKFVRAKTIRLDRQEVSFETGESLQVFFSCRHTSGLMDKLMARHGLKVERHWLSDSGEEGVFLVRFSN